MTSETRSTHQRSSTPSHGEGEHPAHTGGHPAPGEEKYPHLTPDEDPPGDLHTTRLLLAMPAIVLAVTVLVVVLHAIAPVLIVIPLLGVVGGMAYLLVTLLQATDDEQPEPTAREHDRPEGPQRLVIPEHPHQGRRRPDQRPLLRI
ncbi:hypothetical protein SK069_12250 [Patulibacter brassicae]|jgi:hypothetical protein|uniref:Uncharacterized protein n=1 Tax=Patulibacter brassicae TaxID=1705717 RepID=A0ABU4VLY0_9ACTN|nr:hypothetical protein [Patulibacter brassicae]MDX8152372.1 hypothetical protein [Patulibacter brassicae]